jgi:hypothetical protein
MTGQRNHMFQSSIKISLVQMGMKMCLIIHGPALKEDAGAKEKIKQGLLKFLKNIFKLEPTIIQILHLTRRSIRMESLNLNKANVTIFLKFKVFHKLISTDSTFADSEVDKLLKMSKELTLKLKTVPKVHHLVQLLQARKTPFATPLNSTNLHALSL